MDGDRYEETRNKKLKLEETSDTFMSDNKQDYTKTKDKESSPKQIHVEVNLRHTCDQCNYKTTNKGHLNRHIDSVHGNVRYSCDKCDYKAKRKGHLKRHIDSGRCVKQL